MELSCLCRRIIIYVLMVHMMNPAASFIHDDPVFFLSWLMSDILVNMLKKEKKRAADAVSALEQRGHSLPKSSSSMSENGTSPSSGMSNGTTPMSNHQHMSDRAPSDRRWQSDQQKLQKEKEEITKAKICKIQFIIIISFYMKIVDKTAETVAINIC